MTYQYARLAVGIKPQYRDACCTVPCDRYGNVLTPLSEEEEMFKYWSKKIINYEIRDDVMYCWLDVGS